MELAERIDEILRRLGMEYELLGIITQLAEGSYIGKNHKYAEIERSRNYEATNN